MHEANVGTRGKGRFDGEVGTLRQQFFDALEHQPTGLHSHLVGRKR